MKRFYAVTVDFCNVERIFGFADKSERDEFAAASCGNCPLTRNEVSQRLATNRRIAKENKADRGWVNGLPTSWDDVVEYARTK